MEFNIWQLIAIGLFTEMYYSRYVKALQGKKSRVRVLSVDVPVEREAKASVLVENHN